MSYDRESGAGSGAIDAEFSAGLPAGWCWATLADLAAPEKNAVTDGPFGSHLKTAHYTETGPRVIRLQNVGHSVFKDAQAHISTIHYASLRRHSAQPGDLVIAALGEDLPRACVIPDWLGPAVVKADCIRVRPSPIAVHVQFLNYAINAPDTRRRTADVVHAVGRPRLTLGQIKSIRVPLAPLNQQRRVADTLDELFSDLDAAVAALERVRVKLKLYRASVLKAAVEGALTAEWRAQHPTVEPASELLDRILAERRRIWEGGQVAKFKAKGGQPPSNWRAKYKEPATHGTTHLPPLPAGWCWATIDQVSSEVSNGYSSKPDAPSGVPMLRISAVRPYALDLEDVRYLSGDPAVYADSLIQPRDLLFTRYNGTRRLVGVCAVVPMIERPIVHPDKLIRARPLPSVTTPSFLAIAANVGTSCAASTILAGARQLDLPVPCGW